MKLLAKVKKHAGETDNKLIYVVIAILLLGGGVYAGVSQQNKTELAETNPSPTVVPDNALEHSVIYGVWSGNNSLVKAYNIATKSTYVLATLPQNVKRVTASMPDTLYYINNTNEFDHGTEVVKYTIPGGSKSTVIKADPGFGIDDYYISPNGNYITTWEISIASGNTILYGGKSRVYVVDTKTNAKNLIYDEVADKPIHYPRGITDNGNVISDMFLPNSGPGWGYGMGNSAPAGEKKFDSTVMTNGSYGRQPRIDSSGKWLSFTGYDGADGSGTEQVHGIRRALLQPNTVEVVSADTLERKKLTNLSNRFIYDDAKIDKSGNYVIISQIKYLNGRYNPHVLIYDLVNNKGIQVRDSMNKRGLAVLSPNHVLVGTPNVSDQTMGNLGETYQFIHNNFELIHPKTGTTLTLPIQDTNLQYIGIVDNSQMSTAGLEVSRDGLQLQTFLLKTELMTNRRALVSRSKFNSAKSSLGVKTIAQAVPGGTGAGPYATTCTGDVDCQSGLCHTQQNQQTNQQVMFCTQMCTTNADCQNGSTCNMNDQGSRICIPDNVFDGGVTAPNNPGGGINTPNNPGGGVTTPNNPGGGVVMPTDPIGPTLPENPPGGEIPGVGEPGEVNPDPVIMNPMGMMEGETQN